jgi:ABC-2 type transport system permease protein
MPSLAIVRHEWRIFCREPMPVALMTLMPLVLMALFKPVFETGAGQTVPGMTVLFGFFLVGQVGYAFFREHAWGTWERLRATDLKRTQLLGAKVVVPLVTFSIQFAILFTAGLTLFGLHVRGSVLGLVAMTVALALMLTAFGVALVSLCRSFMALTTIANMGALAFAGAGGALVPFVLLPGWIQAIAPFTPGYWAMEGFTRAIEGTGGSVLGPLVILLGWTALFCAITAWRLRFEETKTGWA